MMRDVALERMDLVSQKIVDSIDAPDGWFQVFFFFITLGLKLNDTKVYESEIRALLLVPGSFVLPFHAMDFENFVASKF